MTRAWLLVLCVGLFGCPTQQTPIEDAGTEEEVPYEGETIGGAIPILPPESPTIDLDAGPFEVERRCCQVIFSIPDREPGETTGRLVGTLPPLNDGGVELMRGSNQWVGTACLPMKTTTLYWYEFTTDAGATDAGVEPVTIRYDENASITPGFSGGIVNVFPSVDSCASVDAATMTPP